MPRKDLRDRQVIQHLDLQELRVQQALVEIRDQLHLQDLRVSKDQRVIKVSKDQSETLHKVQKDLRVVHLRVQLVLEETKDLVDHRVTQHKDLQDQQDLVVVVVTKDLQETQEPKDLKVRLHLQDHKVTKDQKDQKDRRDLKVTLR
jgi:LAS superfamily LD-carboxypeptidase LdcB